MPTDKNLEIVLVDVSRIIPYWRNPRRNDQTVEWLCKIIPQYGFNVPLVLDRQNVVIKGHARLKAAKRLGLDKVPCIYSDNDDEHNKADRIADNKIQEMSYWDFEKLEMEYQRIGDLKFDKLFHPEEITATDYQPDALPAFEGTSLDDYDFGQDNDSAAVSPVSTGEIVNFEAYQKPQESPSEPSWSEGEGTGGEAPQNWSEASSGQTESILPKGNRALKTLCPYCGATVYIRM